MSANKDFLSEFNWLFEFLSMKGMKFHRKEQLEGKIETHAHVFYWTN